MQMTKFSTCPNLSPTLVLICPLPFVWNIFSPFREGFKLSASSTIELTSLCSLNRGKHFSLSLYLPTVFILLTVSLYALFSFVFKKSSFTTVSVSFCIFLFHISQTYSFHLQCQCRHDYLSAELLRWLPNWSYCLQESMISMYCAWLHWISFPNTSGSASKEVRLMLHISKINHMSNSL